MFGGETGKDASPGSTVARPVVAQPFQSSGHCPFCFSVSKQHPASERSDPTARGHFRRSRPRTIGKLRRPQKMKTAIADSGGARRVNRSLQRQDCPTRRFRAAFRPEVKSPTAIRVLGISQERQAEFANKQRIVGMIQGARISLFIGSHIFGVPTPSHDLGGRFFILLHRLTSRLLDSELGDQPV